MGVRSLGNALASFGYKFGTTGLEAVGAPPPPPAGITASGGVLSMIMKTVELSTEHMSLPHRAHLPYQILGLYHQLLSIL